MDAKICILIPARDRAEGVDACGGRALVASGDIERDEGAIHGPQKPVLYAVWGVTKLVKARDRPEGVHAFGVSDHSSGDIERDEGATRIPQKSVQVMN